MTNNGILGSRGRALGEPQGTPTFGSQPVFEPTSNTMQYRRGPNFIPGLSLYGCKPDSFARWRAGLARARAGGAAAHLLCGPGDSTTLGTGSNGGTSGRIVSATYPGRLQTMLGQAGRYGTSREGALFFAFEGTGTPAPRHTLGTGWAAGGPANSMQAAAGAAGTLDITPTVNVDTFVVYYVRWGGGSTLSAVVDSGSAVTQSSNGSNALGIWTIAAGSPGAHVLHLSSTGTGTAYIRGWEAYDSTNPAGVRVTRYGDAGATATSNYPSGGGYDGVDGLVALTPDLSIACLGVNDAFGSISLPTYKAAMRRISLALLAGNSSVMLMAQWQPNNSWNNALQWPLFVQAQYELADELGIPLLDLTARYNVPSAANQNPYGLFQDNVHPNPSGHADWAAAVAQVIQHVS
jgi:hypothetical protein